MAYFKIGIFTLCLSFCATLQATYQRYGRETLDSLQASGVVVLDGTVVLGTLKVNGNLEATNANIGSLQVFGQAELYNCVIPNQTSIRGALTAVKTSFRGPLVVASQKIILKSSTAPSITVRAINGYAGVQYIVLSQWSKVHGPITVLSGRGEVWSSTYSSILGPITGARLYNQVLD